MERTASRVDRRSGRSEPWNGYRWRASRTIQPAGGGPRTRLRAPSMTIHYVYSHRLVNEIVGFRTAVAPDAYRTSRSGDWFSLYRNGAVGNPAPRLWQRPSRLP